MFYASVADSLVPRGRCTALSDGLQGSGMKLPASGKPKNCRLTFGEASLAAASVSGSTAQIVIVSSKNNMKLPTTTGSGLIRKA